MQKSVYVVLIYEIQKRIHKTIRFSLVSFLDGLEQIG